MKYIFKCDCGKESTKEFKMSEVSKSVVLCEDCGKQMHQIYRNSNLINPEHMKSEQINDMSYVSRIMKNRPTGRTKSIY